MLVVLDGAVGERGELAAFHTDGMYFGNFVCNGTQSRHRTEWNTPEVHVQSGNNDAYTIVGKLVAYINQAAIKNWASSMPTTSISEVKSRMLADESMGVEAME